MADSTQFPWQDPRWQAQAHDWIREETRKKSIQIIGEIEQPHVVHWSTVMRAPSNEGFIYFKATAGETIYEIALTEKLAAWFPDVMPQLIAIDTTRGWMLMRDGGEQLRASVRPTKDIKPWESVIPQYAQLQVGLSQHLGEILGLGLPDHRLAVLPALYSQLLTDAEILRVGQDKGLTSDEFEQLQNSKNRFAQICADLSACGIPESLNHGDFHDGNVLVKDERITFFDWGDASVTHPFVTLRTLWVSIEIALELEDYAFTPQMETLLDSYLNEWRSFGSKDKLMEAYVLSRPVASLVKSLQWYQSITQMDESVQKDYLWIVPSVLQEVLYHMGKLENLDKN